MLYKKQRGAQPGTPLLYSVDESYFIVFSVLLGSALARSSAVL